MELVNTCPGASYSIKRRLAHKRQAVTAANDVISVLNELNAGWESRGSPTLAQVTAGNEFLRQVRLAPPTQKVYTCCGAACELLASN
eukprot:11364871-Karenia_brevis.AAC.1